MLWVVLCTPAMFAGEQRHTYISLVRPCPRSQNSIMGSVRSKRAGAASNPKPRCLHQEQEVVEQWVARVGSKDAESDGREERWHLTGDKRRLTKPNPSFKTQAY